MNNVHFQFREWWENVTWWILQHCERHTERRNATKTRPRQRRGKSSLVVKKTDGVKETVFTRMEGPTQPVEVEDRLWLWALGLAASLWKYCEGAEPSLWAVAFQGYRGRGGERLAVLRCYGGVEGRFTREVRERMKKKMNMHRAEEESMDSTEKTQFVRRRRKDKRAAQNRRTPKNRNVEEIWSKLNDWNRRATFTWPKVQTHSCTLVTSVRNIYTLQQLNSFFFLQSYDDKIKHFTCLYLIYSKC